MTFNRLFHSPVKVYRNRGLESLYSHFIWSFCFDSCSLYTLLICISNREDDMHVLWKTKRKEKNSFIEHINKMAKQRQQQHQQKRQFYKRIEKTKQLPWNWIHFFPLNFLRSLFCYLFIRDISLNTYIRRHVWIHIYRLVCRLCAVCVCVCVCQAQTFHNSFNVYFFLSLYSIQCVFFCSFPSNEKFHSLRMMNATHSI